MAILVGFAALAFSLYKIVHMPLAAWKSRSRYLDSPTMLRVWDLLHLALTHGVTAKLLRQELLLVSLDLELGTLVTEH